MNTPENNLITVFTAKELTLLYKTFLEIIEDLKKDHQIMVTKIADQHGQQFASDINYFTSEKYEQLRKRVLDQGNECSRRIISFLDFFEFTINNLKVAEAAKQKRNIVKKFVTYPPIIVE
jgi:hypothetical protein